MIFCVRLGLQFYYSTEKKKLFFIINKQAVLDFHHCEIVRKTYIKKIMFNCKLLNNYIFFCFGLFCYSTNRSKLYIKFNKLLIKQTAFFCKRIWIKKRLTFNLKTRCTRKSGQRKKCTLQINRRSEIDLKKKELQKNLLL